MTKQEARKYFTAQRLCLSADAVQRQSEQIKALLLAHFAPENYEFMHVFWPILAKNEVDTRAFIRYLQVYFPQVTLVFPRVEQHPVLHLSHYALRPDTQWRTNRWGIAEPQATPEHAVRPERLDWVMVPLLAFDEQGQRVGYGKGFYDQLLTQCRPEVPKVGVSFFDPIAQISDAEAHDFRLTHAVTPTQIWHFAEPTH
jgi:5-formyltetrahydrofolate cyclo-ligase